MRGDIVLFIKTIFPLLGRRMNNRNNIIVLTIAFSFLFAGHLYAESDQISEWKSVKFPGIKENKFVIDQNGKIDLFMDKSSSLLIRPLNETEQNKTTLKWQWKVDKNFPPTPLADETVDDRPVAVHIWFPKIKTDKSGGFKEFFGRLLGYNFPGRVISYVWGGTEEVNEVIENPHFKERGYQIILRQGQYNSESWINEQVNFKQDYEKIFEGVAPLPTHIAVSGDTDSIQQMATSSVRRISLLE